MLDWSVVNGQVRHVLTAGAGALVTDGVISNSDAQIGVAILMFVVGAAWSWLNKVLHRDALERAGRRMA